ncbi:MAG TPA: SAM-dependent methyltransferase [Dehalococcoidia bacterium]|nr:SAM-dependent methyltransferase [Dehalococcoidia bacterium]
MVLYDLGPGDEDVALKDIIASRIRREGPLTFSDFMALALYEPGHGYYVNCDPARDYQTSPNVHPVFGACVARQLGEMWRILGRPDRFDVLEAGAGDGRLALDIAAWLRAHDQDAFAALSLRLQDVTYGARPPAHARELSALLGGRVSFGEQIAGRLTGCILSNELLDAFPVRRVRVERGRLLELRVGWDEAGFVDVPWEPSPEVECYFQELGMLPGEGCEAEANLEAPAWMQRAAAVLDRGYVLTLDYGYEAASLYAPWRKRGTLLTFYRHTAGEDPYVRVGRQDITASVDLTTVARAGEEAGLRTLGLTAQSEFLSALGIGEALAQRPDPSQLEAYYALRRAAVELTDPTGLGRIKVLVQGKDVPDTPLTGLSGREAGRA